MKILSTKVKNCLKTPKLWGPKWTKKLFIQISVTPIGAESGGISQTKKLLFPSVMLGYTPFKTPSAMLGPPGGHFGFMLFFFFLLSLSLNLLFLSSCSYSISCLRFLSSRHGILHKPSASTKFWPKSFHKSNMIFVLFS